MIEVFKPTICSDIEFVQEVALALSEADGPQTIWVSCEEAPENAHKRKVEYEKRFEVSASWGVE